MTSQDVLDQKVAELSEKIKQSTGAGDYTAAKQYQTQINQLKETYKIDVVAELTSEHEQFVRAIDDAYAEEELNFNTQWEHRLDEFNQAATEKMNEMKEELQQKLVKLEEMCKQKPVRFSSQVLNLRDQEARLAKNQRFDEAKAVQKQADEMEQDEIQQHRLSQQQYKDQQKLDLYRFYEKQSKALMTKIEAGRADIISKWSSDMDKLDKHHEAMLKAEDIRFNKQKQTKVSSLTLNSSKTQVDLAKIREVGSPVQQYIRQDGAQVDTQYLGSSMGPIISKTQGMAKLK